MAIHTEDDAPTPSETLRYLHTDHLGSVDTITDDAGAVVERLSYDAWGKRRTASGTDVWEDPALPIAAEETRRGFTDHEHLDDFALVHMNARVYDPKLGRFLSPDPFIQFPESTQGFNRYTYTLNNPLSFTDPTGYYVSRGNPHTDPPSDGGDNGDGADPQSSANPASETGTEGSNSHNTAPGHTDDVTPVPSYPNPHSDEGDLEDAVAEEKVFVDRWPDRIIIQRGKGTVIVQNNVPENGIPQITRDQVREALDVSEQEGKPVQIISGYREDSVAHREHRAMDVKIDGYSSEDTAKAFAKSGLFSRVASYTDGRTAAHVDHMPSDHSRYEGRKPDQKWYEVED